MEKRLKLKDNVLATIEIATFLTVVISLILKFGG